MMEFKGPRYMGGWIGLAIAAAGAAYDSYEKNKSDNKDRQNKIDQEAQRGLDNIWLDQQKRKFELQDRQYKEGAIRQYAPFYKGPDMPDPKLTDPNQPGLADWQPRVGNDVPILSSGYPYAGQNPNG